MKTDNTLQYRPELDGLRAISLLFIIIFHLGLDFFPGGFVAVDVFFVISGFLITSIILKSKTGSGFSFLQFYQRRAVRLAPAYWLVLTITTIVAFLLLLPAEMVIYLESVVYSSAFLANVFMWDKVGGYFDHGAEIHPLLHLWTLAVEEQFYIIWPLTLIVLAKIFRNILVPLCILLLLALFLAQWGGLNYKAAAYYLMPTRAFALVLGALLVFAPAMSLNMQTKNFLTSLGFLLIVYGALILDKSSVYPGFYTLLPCVGTALIILFSNHKTDFIGRCLSIRPLSFIGEISYPGYLWHWPVISFAYIYKVEMTFLIVISIFLITFLLAIPTYLFVERPFKKYNQANPWKVLLLFFIVPALIFISFSLLAIYEKAWPSRVSTEMALKSKAVLSYANEERGHCHQGPVNFPLPPEYCVLGEKNAPVSVLLIGDSYANHFSGFIDILLKNAQRRGYDITQNSTPFLPDLSRFGQNKSEPRKYEIFRLRNDFLVKHIESSDYDFVVMAGAFSTFIKKGIWDINNSEEENRLAFKEAFIQAIDLVIEQGAVPVLIEGAPVPETSLAHCTLNNLRFGWNKKCVFSRQAHEADFRDWHDFLNELEQAFPSLLVLEISDLLCDAEHCFSEIDGLPLYRDRGHLNYMGSELLGRLYLEKYANPFVME